MTDHSITSLIEKLEGAEVGNRELDALVSVALKLDCKPNLTDDLHSLRPIRKDDHCAPGTYWFVQRSGMSLRASEPVTTSLDAALALAERVLPGYAMNACKDLGPTEGPDFRWSSVVAPRSLEGPVGRKGWHFGVADTPAVALCIAILKSLRAQSEARV